MSFLEANPPLITASQIFGFNQWLVQPTYDGTRLSVTSTTYTANGPTLSALADGRYIVLYGFTGFNDTSPAAAIMSINVNGTGAFDSDGCWLKDIQQDCSAMTVRQKTLMGGSNTITASYRAADSGTAVFGNRVLIAVRYSNV